MFVLWCLEGMVGLGLGLWRLVGFSVTRPACLQRCCYTCTCMWDVSYASGAWSLSVVTVQVHDGYGCDWQLLLSQNVTGHVWVAQGCDCVRRRVLLCYWVVRQVRVCPAHRGRQSMCTFDPSGQLAECLFDRFKMGMTDLLKHGQGEQLIHAPSHCVIPTRFLHSVGCVDGNGFRIGMLGLEAAVVLLLCRAFCCTAFLLCWLTFVWCC
jgi:hypothetical protein